MKTHTGACHCGNVQYQVELDLTQAVIECNCSHCAIKGILWQFVGAQAFTLTKGQDSLKEYLFNTQKIRHQFCTTCGVEPFAYGENKGEKTVAINVRTIRDIDLDSLTHTKANGKDF